jgi:competence protein ComEA
MNRQRSMPYALLAVLTAAFALAGPAAVRAEDAPPPRPGAAKASPLGVVDVNSATEQQLVEVPGIGEGLARRIVQFREKNGPYQRIEDLLKVQGIGEKSLEKLRPYLTAGKKS